MEAISHPDKNYALQNFLELAVNFNIPIKDFIDYHVNQAVGNQTQKPNQSQQQEEIPQPLKQFIDTVGGEIQGIKSQFQQQKEAAAVQYVNNWAADKPHFNAVRNHMFALLQSGVIPLKNGQLDLDEAYSQAVYANPSIRDLVKQEQEAKAIQQAETERQQAELARLKKVEKARKSATLSNRAPSGSPNNSTINNKTQTVAESIRAAMAEINGR